MSARTVAFATFVAVTLLFALSEGSNFLNHSVIALVSGIAVAVAVWFVPTASERGKPSDQRVRDAVWNAQKSTQLVVGGAVTVVANLLPAVDKMAVLLGILAAYTVTEMSHSKRNDQRTMRPRH